MARTLADQRREKVRSAELNAAAKVNLDDLFSQIKEGEVKNLNLIIKGDVQGSVGALVSSLEKLNKELRKFHM